MSKLSSWKTIFCLCVFCSVAAIASPAQTFKTLVSFNGTNGANPGWMSLIQGTDGNFYGTTENGGAHGHGTIFKITPAGTLTTLHNFCSQPNCTDGASPVAGLVQATSGNFYGTTSGGGAYNHGSLFEITAAGKLTTLYNFCSLANCADGLSPYAAPLQATDGDLYGTTYLGGANNYGTVFKLSPAKGADKEKVLYSFGANSNDGTQPYAGVTLDRARNIYGTAALGGQGYGTVFELTPSKSGWTEQIIHTFGNVTDGGTPYAGLSFDAQGNLFGATTQGPGAGGGTFFELTPSNGTWSFNTIYSLSGWGISGEFRTAYLDPSDNIFGTTHCDGQYSSGSVYELQRSGSAYNYVDLYDFTGGTDGQYVFSNPAFDAHGNIFGTTNVGGSGYGVVWEVRAAGKTGRRHV